MSEKSKAQIGDKFEKGIESPTKPQTSEALHGELQGQCARTLTDYNALLHSDVGENYQAFFGAAMLICGFLMNDDTEVIAENEKNKDTGNVKMSSKSTSPTTAKEKKNVNDKKIREIAKKLEKKKKELKKPKEVAVGLQKAKEKFQPSNIFYVGDSYMRTMTKGKSISNRKIGGNKHAVGSRPLIAFGKGGYNKRWGGNDVETVAHQALDNPECKVLSFIAGLNDFYTFPNPKKVYDRVKISIENIIKRAKNRPAELGGPVKVVICKIPKIRRIPNKKNSKEPDYERKRKINYYTDLLNNELDNEWILNTESNIALIDTNGAIGDNWGDSIHPNKTGYDNIYKEIQAAIV